MLHRCLWLMLDLEGSIYCSTAWFLYHNSTSKNCQANCWLTLFLVFLLDDFCPKAWNRFHTRYAEMIPLECNFSADNIVFNWFLTRVTIPFKHLQCVHLMRVANHCWYLFANSRELANSLCVRLHYSIIPPLRTEGTALGSRIREDDRCQRLKIKD